MSHKENEQSKASKRNETAADRFNLHYHNAQTALESIIESIKELSDDQAASPQSWIIVGTMAETAKRLDELAKFLAH